MDLVTHEGCVAGGEDAFLLDVTDKAKGGQYQCLDPVTLHERILEDQRRLWDLVLTRNQDQFHIIPRKARGWQLHPVSG
jgi:hypothetical protein